MVIADVVGILKHTDNENFNTECNRQALKVGYIIQSTSVMTDPEGYVTKVHYN
jgi:hypothetical protein